MDGARQQQLQALANKLRRRVIDTLWQAQAGHPGGSLSAAEIMATLFFDVMRIDPAVPQWEERDRFILSKGHAAPIYYVTLAEAGFFPEEVLCTYDCLDSCLQGHPDVKAPGVDVPSGSLGQGLSVGLGLALGARLRKQPLRVYVIMGDGELQEGQVWEAAMSAPYFELDNVTAIVDCNSVQLMGPVDQIMSIEPLAEKWEAFNWNVIEIDGHDVAQIADACERAARTKGRPTVILARTVKGKGVSFMENDAYWHSGLVTDEVRQKALAELGGEGDVMVGEMMAARDAFGRALVDLGKVDPRIVVCDADLGSSTKAQMFGDAYPERFFQVGIAEQNMVGIAAGLAHMGFVAFISTFACFASKRVTDQVRVMVAQPELPVVIVGAYSGMLAGKTGKTHQAIQDAAIYRAMPNMTVVSPGDGVEVRKAVFAAADYGKPVYLRLTRDPTPVIFGDDYDFKIGKATVVRQGSDVSIITTGIMLPRALDAAEALSKEGISAHILHVPTLKPLDTEAIVAAARKTGLVVTAEEHTIIGGLGGAVAETLGEHAPTLMRRVGVKDVFGESAPNDELLVKYGLTAADIAEAARGLCTNPRNRDQ